MSYIGQTASGTGSGMVAHNTNKTFSVTLPSKGTWIVIITGRLQNGLANKRLHVKLSGLLPIYFDGELSHGDIFPSACLSNIVVGNQFTIIFNQWTGSSCTVDFVYSAVRIK